jgi:hypothetical protein
LACLADQTDWKTDVGTRSAATMITAKILMRDNSVTLNGIGLWIGLLLATVLMSLLVVHVVGVLSDFSAAIHYPLGLDYGEGIVWQQAELIPGPRMYSNSTELPFIVFHYPPLYYLFVHATRFLQPSFLAAGRLVSSSSAVLVALSVVGLVRIATQRYGRVFSTAEFGIALATGLLALCLNPVREWGSYMRVDMAAIALGMLGTLVGAWANGRFYGTTAALLLCLASVFTKQTLLPAGVAVFVIALLRSPRNALCAATIVGTIGLAAFGLMEALTDGGFLRHIVEYNLNRFSLQWGFITVWAERDSLLFIALVLWAASVVALDPVRQRDASQGRPALSQRLMQFRQADRATAARAILLLHMRLASLMLFTLFKSGSSSNYLLDCLCVGSVLIGVCLCDLANFKGRLALPTGLLILGLLNLGMLNVPVRQVPDQLSKGQVDRLALVRRIAAAKKPVASEDMTLLMLAGKPVIFEPAIVTELASVGRWDEAPLVDMIRSGGFAFMITGADTGAGSTPRRTSAVDAAMRDAYPDVEQVGGLSLHLPPR